MEVEVGQSKKLPRPVESTRIPLDVAKRESCCLCHDLQEDATCYQRRIVSKGDTNVMI